MDFIDTKGFSHFIEESRIFDKTMALMHEYLKNYYEEEPEQFLDVLRAPYETVKAAYKFERCIVALNKNFCYDPPLDVITCSIMIHDPDGTWLGDYRAFYDYDLEAFDDTFER